jgi:hypothetical protein
MRKIEKNAAVTGELNDNELDLVAGGLSDFMSAVIMAVAAVKTERYMEATRVCPAQ